MIKKRDKLQKIENGTMRYEEGDFSFWHYLTILTQSNESFDLVNQFDLMVAQFGLPSMPKREIVDIFLKQAHCE